MKQLQIEDIFKIKEMIKGIDLDLRFIAANNTYLTDEGFVTFYFFKGVPVLQHFFIDKNKRHIKTARRLVKEFVRLLKGSGYKYFLVSAKNDLKKVIEYYFKIKPKGSIGESDYFLVEV